MEENLNSSDTVLSENAAKRRRYRERLKLRRDAGLLVPSRTNTAVFVSCLPPDVSLRELVDVFSNAGPIKKKHDTQEYLVKLYYHADGTPKNEALIVYQNKESVAVSISRNNGTCICGNSTPMIVEEANFSTKGDQMKAPSTLSNEELKQMVSKKPRVAHKTRKPIVLLSGIPMGHKSADEVSSDLEAMLRAMGVADGLKRVTVIDGTEFACCRYINPSSRDLAFDKLSMLSSSHQLEYMGSSLEVEIFDGRDLKDSQSRASDAKDETLSSWDAFMDDSSD